MIYIFKKGIMVCKVNDVINKYLYLKKVRLFFIWFYFIYRYIFLCDKWFLVEEEDGMIDRIFFVLSNDDIIFFNNFFFDYV